MKDIESIGFFVDTDHGPIVEVLIRRKKVDENTQQA